jgi:hypothetical protein
MARIPGALDLFVRESAVTDCAAALGPQLRLIWRVLAEALDCFGVVIDRCFKKSAPAWGVVLF